MSSGDGRTLSYTSFDKPDFIEKGSHSTAMLYGAGRQLTYRRDIDTVGGTNTETYLIGPYERVIYHAGPEASRVASFSRRRS